MVIALAGRRVDAEGANPARFPLDHVALVRERILAVFESQNARALVSSAACGADLIAQQVAQCLGVHRRIVLPFAPDRFRNTSVTDRPGDWGPIYDSLVAQSIATGDLVNLETRLQSGTDDDRAYAMVNQAILDEALALGAEFGDTVGAVLVWDGESRGLADLTEAFGVEARKRALRVIEVRTV